MLGFCVGLGLVLGWMRGVAFLHRLEPYQAVAYRDVVIRVVAQTDAAYGPNGQLLFDGGQARLVEPFSAVLPGRLKVQGYGASAVYRGDAVEVKANLYPTRGSRQASLSYARLRVTGRGGSWIDVARRKFVAGMQSALAEPHASFALGLLVGQRSTLPESVAAGLSAVGLTHIIAVSGYNLTIIVRATRRFGGQRSKYQVTLASLVLIGGFVLVTGFSASIVRAAIVSVLSLWAWYYGRAFKPFVLLILVAALTAAWSPLYLWSDIGWYLSFLAFFGVMVWVPLAVDRVYGLRAKPGAMKLLLYETIGAQLMTAPLIMHIFGEVSLIALASNVLLVPVVPMAMLLSFVAGLAGMVLPVMSGWVALPAAWVLRYMLQTVAVLARVPHALAPATLPMSYLVGLYGLIVLICLSLWRNNRAKHGTITDTEMMFAEER